MSERAGINNDEIGAVCAGQVDAIDQRTLVIGLKENDLRIFLCAAGASSLSMSASVWLPYTAGSRVPSRFKLGPLRTRIRLTTIAL